MAQDLQSAGVQGQEFEPENMLRQLQQIAGQPPAQLPPASAAEAVGAGMTGMAAGFRGQHNPALIQRDAQLRQAQAVQQAQTHNQFQLFGAVQSVQRERRLRENDLQQVLTTLSQSDNDDARNAGLRGLMQIAKTRGVQVPELGDALLKKRMKFSDLQGIAKMVDYDATDEAISAAFPSASPATIQEARFNRDNPNFRSAFGLQSAEDRDKDRLVNAEKSISILRTKYGLQEPRILDMVAQHHVRNFGTSFFEDKNEEHRRASLAVAEGATGMEKPTTAMRNAVATYAKDLGIKPDSTDPIDINRAMARARADKATQAFEIAAGKGQLTAAGAVLSQGLKNLQVKRTKMADVETLIGDMEELITEGKRLGMNTNSRIINAARQELATWTASGKQGRLSEQAEWVRKYATLDSRFATVAQAIENITGNRLAVTNVERALGFHPQIKDPEPVQRAVMGRLKKAYKDAQSKLEQETNTLLTQSSSIAEQAGAPMLIGPLAPTRRIQSIEEDKD